MALDIKGAKRVFNHNSEKLEDPDPFLSPDQVRKFYAAARPELTTAHVAGPKIEGEEIHYEFTTTVGTKG